MFFLEAVVLFFVFSGIALAVFSAVFNRPARAVLSALFSVSVFLFSKTAIIMWLYFDLEKGETLKLTPGDYLVLFISFLVVPIIIALMIPPVRWYIIGWMADSDFVFTTVSEGHFKIVQRLGAFRRVILAKEGHKLNEDGRIVPLKPDEEHGEFLPGGARLVGWPGIDKIYSRELKFKKSLQDQVKEYNEENVSQFFAKVDYPYAVPFVECEDINNIPITGHATLLAHVDHPYLSLFATANFYETMLGLVLPVLRECFEGYSFTQLKEDKRKQDLDKRLWIFLSDPKRNPQPGSKTSVIDELWEKYGIGIVALRIVLLDPPESARAASMRKWEATMDRDAAKVIAEKEAIEVGEPIELMVDRQILAMKKHVPLTKDDVNRIREESLNQLTRYRTMKTGGRLVDNRIANADGSSFANASIGQIVAAVIAAAASAGMQQNPPANPGGQQNQGNPGRQGAQGGQQKPQNPPTTKPGGKNPPTASSKTLKEQADDYFIMKKKYPKWDPEKREPN